MKCINCVGCVRQCRHILYKFSWKLTKFYYIIVPNFGNNLQNSFFSDWFFNELSFFTFFVLLQPSWSTLKFSTISNGPIFNLCMPYTVLILIIWTREKKNEQLRNLFFWNSMVLREYNRSKGFVYSCYNFRKILLLFLFLN